ncbi:tetraspanin-6-like [Lucilia sericata]|uniref:tetraspanin-6-like n=1 Tax=Lucilia sericata TaxID=13632 RepID=UPI0018A80D99|nr:tetraspanin-6-like [Lucilia sericata]
MNYYNNDRYVSYPCVRALLMLFNIAFWISGLSLIWIGIWMQTDFQNYLQINSAYSDQAPYVLLIIGAVIVFVSSLACSCIVKVQSSMLVVYGGFLITMLFSLISLSVYVYTYKDELLDGVSSGISNQIENYDHQHPGNSANIMDFIQRNLQCCGNESFLDWPQNSIPSSCFRSQRMSVHKTTTDANNVYEIGCQYKLRSLINNNFTTVGVATSAIALFPLFGSILSLGLSMMYNKGGYEIII